MQHSRYLNTNVPNPGQAQNAGVVLAGDGGFMWDQWCSGAGDANAVKVRFYVVPQNFDMSWPGYFIEGGAIPGNLMAAAVAAVECFRAPGQQVTCTSGGGWQAKPPGVNPAMTMNVPPLGNGEDPITGQVYNLPNAGGYKVALYIRTGSGAMYGPKPVPLGGYQLSKLPAFFQPTHEPPRDARKMPRGGQRQTKTFTRLRLPW